MKLSIALATAGTILLPTASAGESSYQLQQHIYREVDDVLENLAEYSKLWIEVPKRTSRGNCVWSECGLDDQTDDAHMGDHRDGDGRWYKFRTQGFCANAAFSLYGVTKGNLSSGSCNRKHFINSFFTYGGADRLLQAVGATAEVYYEDGDEGRRRRRLEDEADRWGGNAECVEIYSISGGGNGGRELQGSQDQNNYNGYSSTLACDANGRYIMGAFQGSSCNGNYFIKSLDSMDDYNSEHSDIGCHKIWNGGDSETDYSNETVYTLLKDSWACDTRLYPHACPDPYGEKARDEYALWTAAHGGNGMLAYKSQEFKRPLIYVAWAFFGSAVFIFISSYCFKNQSRIKKVGAGEVIMRDMKNGWEKATLATLGGASAAKVKISPCIEMKGNGKGEGEYEIPYNSGGVVA